MRKRIDSTATPRPGLEPERWIDLENCAEIEVTSEDPENPIEGALLPGMGRGWKAAQPGLQTLRILFDEPTTLHRIRLNFMEEQESRTQEFVLRWSGDDHAKREIVRQQFNFVRGSREVENYDVQLQGVMVLELEIVPSIAGGDVCASLAELRIR